MTAQPLSPTQRTPPLGSALAPVALYAVFAGLWILFSDQVVLSLFSDAAHVAFASTIKGGLFVALTSALLYLLLSGWREHIVQAGADHHTQLRNAKFKGTRTLFVVLILAVVAVTFTFVQIRTPQIEAETNENLQVIAQFKAGQIRNWLDERQIDAEVLSASQGLFEQINLWLQNKSDPKLSAVILSRLLHLKEYQRFNAVVLFDAAGHKVLGADHHLADSPALRTLVDQARATGKVQRSDLVLDADDHAHQDWAVPVLVASSADPGAVVAVVVMHTHAADFLFPLIQSWPSASASAETLLVRREGDSVVYLSPLRYRPHTTLGLRLPIARTTLPAAQAVLSEGAGTVRGPDYRGVDVLTAYSPIDGTSWRILTKVDYAEVMVPLWQSTYWLATVAGAAVLAILVALMLLWRQTQRAQKYALLAQKNEADQLLAALVNSSTDAIFVKDVAGKHLLVNRAAERVLGRTAEQIVGHDATSLFPEHAAQVSTNDQEVMRSNRVCTFEETVVTAAGLRTFLVNKGPMHDAQGHVVGVYGISRDITERQQALVELQRTSEQLAQHNAELERFNRVAVDRELAMVALKRQVNTLSVELGRAAPFAVDFANSQPAQGLT